MMEVGGAGPEYSHLVGGVGIIARKLLRPILHEPISDEYAEAVSTGRYSIYTVEYGKQKYTSPSSTVGRGGEKETIKGKRCM